MAFVVPPVVKQSERLLLEIERAVMKFGRFHKYSYGTTLRDSAMQVAKLSHRVWRDRAHQAERIGELVWAVDDLKLSLQLGCQMRAFASFAVFEELARLAAEIGRQVGGLHRKQHPKGQNGQRIGDGQRAQILRSLVEWNAHGQAHENIVQADAWDDAHWWMARPNRSNLSVLAAYEVALLE